ncbi:hypothetical protein [Clostridium sp. ZBS13]|nr:hypothetical protein [Clostridium sp. ZBS13]
MIGDGEFYSRSSTFELIVLVDLSVHILVSCSGMYNDLRIILIIQATN